MKQPQIVHNIEKRYKKINVAFDKVIRHYSAEDIHVFRVEVKKLRAFLRLVGAAQDTGKSGFKLPRKLHKFYTAVGDIRSFQIQKQRVRKVLQGKDIIFMEAYLNLLTNKMAKSIAFANALVKGKRPFKKGEQKLLSTLPDKLSRAMIRAFLYSEISKLNILMAPVSPDDESLHSVRKLLKGFLYTWAYTKKDTAVILTDTTFTGRDNIDSVTKLLGDFQDVCAGLSFLHIDYIDQGVNKNETKLLHDIEKKWWKEKEAIRKDIPKIFPKKNLFNVDALISPS